MWPFSVIQIDPSLRTKNHYDAQGYLHKLTDTTSPTSDSIIYWQAKDRNAKGQVLREQSGNSVVTTRAINPANGWINGITTTSNNSNNLNSVSDLFLQQNSYTFDAIGNITERVNHRTGAKENFTYNQLDQLIENSVTVPGQASVTTTISYDQLGNITNKSDVGSYQYNTCTMLARTQSVKLTVSAISMMLTAI